MTKLLISTALIGLLACAGPAWAQRDNRERGDRDRPAQSEAAPKAAPAGPANAPRNGGFMNFGNAPTPPSAAPAARGADENRQGRAMNNNNNTNTRGPSQNDNDRRGADNNRRDNDRGGFNNNRPGFNNDRRGPDSRRDFSAYQRNFSAPRRFRAPSYQRPRGWYAHRWTFGEVLPSIFWAQDYWLNDYRSYDLPPPPPGTVWVRDGDDALLIDRFSGEIIQVAYRVFY